MNLAALQRVAVDALEDVKAQDIKVFDTLGQSSEFDRVIVASGTSNRQTRALAWSVVRKVKEAGGRVVSVEGADTGEWVLVDLGDIVVHIMVPPVRAYYALEEIWGTKPVRLKEPAKKTAVKATPQKAGKRAATKKTAAKKPPAKKAAPRKAATKKSAAKKSAAKKSAAKKSADKKSAARPAKSAAPKAKKTGKSAARTTASHKARR
jgi:ribosome-associated protein